MKIRSIISLCLVVFFTTNTLVPPAMAQQIILPAPGTMLTLSEQPFQPVLLQGLQIDPANPLQLDFIISEGKDALSPDDLKSETTQMAKYFLAALTIPEKDLWVNLSPYEKDRIMPDEFAKTDMGRDLLSQDYILKQLSASLLYPEIESGRTFWQDVYQAALETTGTTDVPTDVFHKIWIMPKSVLIYENEKGALIAKSSLEVKLEEDLVAEGKLTEEQASSNVRHPEERSDEGSPAQSIGSKTNTGDSSLRPSGSAQNDNVSATDALRRAIVPLIEKEVNEGKHFAALRQIYNAVALAGWYKMRLKESIIGKLYADQNKTPGIDINDPQAREKVYQQYLAAFKKGVFDYIKEEVDPATQETLPRKYFSGGTILNVSDKTTLTKDPDAAMSVSRLKTSAVTFRFAFPESSMSSSGKDVHEGIAFTTGISDRLSTRLKEMGMPGAIIKLQEAIDQFGLDSVNIGVEVDASASLALRTKNFLTLESAGEKVGNNVGLKIVVVKTEDRIIGFDVEQAMTAPATPKKLVFSPLGDKRALVVAEAYVGDPVNTNGARTRVMVRFAEGGGSIIVFGNPDFDFGKPESYLRDGLPNLQAFVDVPVWTAADFAREIDQTSGAHQKLYDTRLDPDPNNAFTRALQELSDAAMKPVITVTEEAKEQFLRALSIPKTRRVDGRTVLKVFPRSEGSPASYGLAEAMAEDLHLEFDDGEVLVDQPIADLKKQITTWVSSHLISARDLLEELAKGYKPEVIIRNNFDEHEEHLTTTNKAVDIVITFTDTSNGWRVRLFNRDSVISMEVFLRQKAVPSLEDAVRIFLTAQLSSGVTPDAAMVAGARIDSLSSWTNTRATIYWPVYDEGPSESHHSISYPRSGVMVINGKRQPFKIIQQSTGGRYRATVPGLYVVFMGQEKLIGEIFKDIKKGDWDAGKRWRSKTETRLKLIARAQARPDAAMTVSALVTLDNGDQFSLPDVLETFKAIQAGLQKIEFRNVQGTAVTNTVRAFIPVDKTVLESSLFKRIIGTELMRARNVITVGKESYNVLTPGNGLMVQAESINVSLVNLDVTAANIATLEGFTKPFENWVSAVLGTLGSPEIKVDQKLPSFLDIASYGPLVAASATRDPKIIERIRTFLTDHNEAVKKSITDYLTGTLEPYAALLAVQNELGNEEPARWLLDASWLAAKYDLDKDSFDYVRDHIAFILRSTDYKTPDGKRVLTSFVATDANLLFKRWNLLKAGKKDAEYYRINAELSKAYYAAMAEHLASGSIRRDEQARIVNSHGEPATHVLRTFPAYFARVLPADLEARIRTNPFKTFRLERLDEELVKFLAKQPGETSYWQNLKAKLEERRGPGESWLQAFLNLTYTREDTHDFLFQGVQEEIAAVSELEDISDTKKAAILAVLADWQDFMIEVVFNRSGGGEDWQKPDDAMTNDFSATLNAMFPPTQAGTYLAPSLEAERAHNPLTVRGVEPRGADAQLIANPYLARNESGTASALDLQLRLAVRTLARYGKLLPILTRVVEDPTFADLSWSRILTSIAGSKQDMDTFILTLRMLIEDSKSLAAEPAASTESVSVLQAAQQLEALFVRALELKVAGSLPDEAMTGEEVAVLDSMKVAGLGMERIRDLANDPTGKAFSKLSPDDQVKILKKYPNLKVLIVRSATKVTKEMIDALPSLKLIIRAGHGLDNIKPEAVVAIKARGGNIVGTGGSEDPVSIWAARAAIITAMTGSEVAQDAAPAELWAISEFQAASDKKIKKRPPETQERLRAKAAQLLRAFGPDALASVKGKTMGLIGYGRIGKRTAQIFQAVGMNVLVNSRTFENAAAGNEVAERDATLQKLGFSFSTKNDIYATADYVVLLPSLYDSTKGMIDQRVVEILKNNPNLKAVINPDREGLVDEKAIVDLLRARRDVKYVVDEVPSLPELEELAVYTDHISASTERGEKQVIANTAAILKQAAADDKAMRVKYFPSSGELETIRTAFKDGVDGKQGQAADAVRQMAELMAKARSWSDLQDVLKASGALDVAGMDEYFASAAPLRKRVGALISPQRVQELAGWALDYLDGLPRGKTNLVRAKGKLGMIAEGSGGDVVELLSALSLADTAMTVSEGMTQIREILRSGPQTLQSIQLPGVTPFNSRFHNMSELYADDQTKDGVQRLKWSTAHGIININTGETFEQPQNAAGDVIVYTLDDGDLILWNGPTAPSATDGAMKENPLGGIKLDGVDMQIRYDGEKFTMPEAALRQLDGQSISGLSPVFIGFKPFDVGVFTGVNK